MNIFVTGGTGFIGNHFLEKALTEGHRVTALRRPGAWPRRALAAEPDWVEGALDGNYVAEFAGIDAFVHLASHTPNPPYAPLAECLYWNVYASLKLAEQARKAGVTRFLVAGSCFEYGNAAHRVERIDAATPLEPLLSYPTSKAAASIAFEGFAREHKLRLKIARIYQVYGEGEQETRLWPSLRAAALAGLDFPMTEGLQVRDFIDVVDVAAQLLEALNFKDCEPGAPQSFPVASGRPRTLLDFASEWWKAWGGSGRLLPGAVSYRPGELMRLVPRIDCDQAE